MRLVPLVLLALVGCGDRGLRVYNNPPTVTLTWPLDGAEVYQNEAIFFEGVVDDDGGNDELSVDWIDSVAGPMAEDVEIESDGTVRHISSTLEPGVHTIVLRAIDQDAASEQASIELKIIPVPEKPSITIQHPDTQGNEKGLEGTPFIFMAQVGDFQDPVEDLVVELVASPYGLVCTMSPDGAGTAQCPAILPLGPYNLTFTVTDLDGNQAIANAPFSVVTRGDFDFDLDGFTPNGGDCNDSNKLIYPGAPEICDGLDNDCNGATAIDVGTECYDDDRDGFCEKPPCTNTPNTLSDCDDTNPNRFPDPRAIEIVNNLDDDCDGIIDETTVVYDDDGDGYCENPPCINTTKTGSDCNDANPRVNPGEKEVCGDGFDNNCNGQTNEKDAVGCKNFYMDEDGDTYGISGATQCYCDAGLSPYTGVNTTDCYDKNRDAYPGQPNYFTVKRGDASFDYNCDRAEERRLRGVTTGCKWEFEPFTCETKAEGWVSREPACGVSGTYVGDCDGSYDVLCIFLCAYSDPSLCTHCWDCEADESSETQGCR
jgi:hypothetical protein